MDVSIQIRDRIAKALMQSHWDGNGCGTHGSNACVYCFGPSPMSPYEIADVAISEMERFLRENNGKPQPLDVRPAKYDRLS